MTVRPCERCQAVLRENEIHLTAEKCVEALKAAVIYYSSGCMKEEEAKQMLQDRLKRCTTFLYILLKKAGGSEIFKQKDLIEAAPKATIHVSPSKIDKGAIVVTAMTPEEAELAMADSAKA